MPIATVCNLRCSFCREAHTVRREMNVRDVGPILAQLEHLREQGVTNLTFMGAEAVLRKDFDQVIRRARELGFLGLIATTNGTALSNRRLVDRLAEAGLDGYEFSMHGHTEELCAVISGRDTTYARQMQALANLAELPPERRWLMINTVVCRDNVTSLAEVPRLIRREFPTLDPIHKLKFVSFEGRVLASQAFLRHDDVDIDGLGAALHAEGVRFQLDNFPLCALGRWKRASNDAWIKVRDQRYFGFNRELGVDEDYGAPDRYVPTSYQFVGSNRFVRGICDGCSLAALCPAVEVSYLLCQGSDALTPSDEDPAALAAALAEHFEPAARPTPEALRQRLAALDAEPRDETEPLSGPALRLEHADLALPLVLRIGPADSPTQDALLRTPRFLVLPLSLEADLTADDEPELALLATLATHLEQHDRDGASLAAVQAALAALPWAETPTRLTPELATQLALRGFSRPLPWVDLSLTQRALSAPLPVRLLPRGTTRAVGPPPMLLTRRFAVHPRDGFDPASAGPAALAAMAGLGTRLAALDDAGLSLQQAWERLRTEGSSRGRRHLAPALARRLERLGWPIALTGREPAPGTLVLRLPGLEAPLEVRIVPKEASPRAYATFGRFALSYHSEGDGGLTPELRLWLDRVVALAGLWERRGLSPDEARQRLQTTRWTPVGGPRDAAWAAAAALISGRAPAPTGTAPAAADPAERAVLAFGHPAFEGPLEVVLEARHPQRPAYHQSARFSLGYRLSAAFGRGLPDGPRRFLDHLRAQLDRWDAAGHDFTGVTARAARTAHDGWSPAAAPG